MDKLGFIPNPEQYAPAGDEVIFDNSIDALEFFQDFYGGNGVVLLASISLNNLACSNMLVWVYFDLDAQDIRSLAPVFKLDNPEVFHECEFTKLLPLTNEIFLFWRETLYSTVFTSAGEVAIKKCDRRNEYKISSCSEEYLPSLRNGPTYRHINWNTRRVTSPR